MAGNRVRVGGPYFEDLYRGLRLLCPVHREDTLRTRAEVVDAFRHLHPRRIEHSWARRPDLGYRYDHAHSSAQLLPLLQGCEYVHQTRDVLADGSRLTDHCGLAVRLATTALLTSDPAAAATSENEPEPTLF